jgi:hypothetical protein
MNKMQTKEMQIQRVILPCPECPECRDFNTSRLPAILVCLVWFTQFLSAQTNEIPFQDGEELNYDVRYKYGLVMLKAGTGIYRINETAYNDSDAYKSSLYFKTTSFFDKILKIRDTLDSYISVPGLVPLFHSRSVNEGNYHFQEELVFNKYTPEYSEVSIKRRSDGIIRFDTILYSNNLGIDILNIFLFARALDFTKIENGDFFKFSTFVGKRKNDIIIRYIGQTVIKKNGNKKYKALKLNIDITDAGAFDESKNSMEVWISDDKNKIPISIKAKLKIGAAEANLSSYKNLKNPLDAETQGSRHK